MFGREAREKLQEARQEITALRLELAQVRAELRGETDRVEELVRANTERVLDALHRMTEATRKESYFGIAAERAEVEEEDLPEGAVLAADAVRRMREMTGMTELTTEELRRRKDAWKRDHGQAEV